MNLARSKGFLCLLMKDDSGKDWLEIRQSVATHRVPKHNYPTHLSRLIVDSSLQYFLEVLGHCVQQGSLFNDVSKHLDYSETATVLCALDGGFTVCAGIERDLVEDPTLHRKNTQELCMDENVYVTFPDSRYRSNECTKWINHRMGPNCLACKTNDSSAHEYSVCPIDLRFSSSQAR